MEKLRVGVIGTGGISVHHIDGYLQCPNVELVSFCDINSERLEMMCNKYNITESYTDHKEMLEKSDIDAVSICTSNDAHAEIAINAMKAGKDVLCEKPMALNSEQAQKMLDVSKETGRLLMLGFVRRFGNDAELIMDLKEQGMFGDLYYAKASYLRRFGFPGGWFGNKEKSGGGPLIDLGVHTIDLCCYLMGNPNPVSVSGSISKAIGKPELKEKFVGDVSNSKMKDDIFNVEDLATLYVKFDNGAVLYLDTSFIANIKAPTGKVELFGVKAGAKIDPEVEIYSSIAGKMVDIQPAKRAAFEFKECFRKEVKHFVDCVTKGIPCRNPAEAGVKVTKIIDAGYKSAELGKEIVF